MRLPFCQVDVFTSVPYRGNPVAVVFDADELSSERMQAIAAWTNLSETTFVCRPGSEQADYRLRIFCPANEMRFAGHPTLGSAHALLERGLQPKLPGRLVQECGVGLVSLNVEDGRIALALPPATLSPLDEGVRAALERAIGTRLVAPAKLVDLGVNWLTAQVDSGERLRALQPDMAALAGVARAARCNGINLFGFDDEQIEVRSFAPHEGTPEDPVCGSGNGAVAYYLRALHGPRDYVARQGRCLGRDGYVEIRHAGGAIWLGGAAVTCIEGSIAV